MRQEPDRDTLWTRCGSAARNRFRRDLWRQGVFGSGKLEQVFTVIWTQLQQSSDQVDQGIFTVEVYFYPSKPAETIGELSSASSRAARRRVKRNSNKEPRCLEYLETSGNSYRANEFVLVIDGQESPGITKTGG